MTNENNSQPSTPDSDGQPSPQPPVSPLAPEKREVREQPECCADQEENITTKLERDIKTGEWWLIGINALLLIANIVIASIYYGQLCQMKKATKAAEGANTIAQQALEITNRAYLSISVKETDSPKFLNELMPTIWFNMANVGHTPAFNIIRRKETAFVGPYPRTEPFPDPTETVPWTETVLQGDSPVFPVRAHLLPNDLKHIGNPKDPIKLFIFGRIDYVTFGKPHYSRYCFVFGTRIPKFAEHCQTNNDSD